MKKDVSDGERAGVVLKASLHSPPLLEFGFDYFQLWILIF